MRCSRLAPITAAGARTAGASRHPVVTLLREVEKRTSVTAPTRAGRRRGRGVAPCDLTTSRASSSTSTARSCTEGPTLHLQLRCRRRPDEDPASGRPFVLFTNGSHLPPRPSRTRFAGRARRVGRRAADAARQRACSTSALTSRTARAGVRQRRRRGVPRKRASHWPATTFPMSARCSSRTRTSSTCQLERVACALFMARRLTGSYAPCTRGSTVRSSAAARW